MNALKNLITDPQFMIIWGVLILLSLGYLFYDLTQKNPQIMSLMKWVWGLTVLYSGPIGLAVYFYSGREQIRNDSLWRRGFRSVAHCYSGCGMGEIIGVTITVGILAMGNWGVSIVTFILAYVAGFALTIGPLMQGGEDFNAAFKDALYSETPSITVMEVVAIGTDLWLAGSANFSDPLFWASLIFSLTMGLIAAYPVNVLLIKYSVKEGMMNPKEME